MTRKRGEKSGKRRWTDPVILVPIIVAIITAIVGPAILLILQNPPPAVISTPTPPPTEISTPTPPPTQPEVPSRANITVETDKESYVIGEDFMISGNVGKPEFGKSVRLDIYMPDGGPLAAGNALMAKPERDGSYSYLIYSFTYAGDLVPGTYTVRATYLKQSAETNFEVVQ